MWVGALGPFLDKPRTPATQGASPVSRVSHHGVGSGQYRMPLRFHIALIDQGLCDGLAKAVFFDKGC